MAKDYIIAGNQNYQQKDYSKAELQYRRALEEENNSIKAHYNLGNSLFQQKRYDQARAHYQQVIEHPKASTADKHNAYHNIGKSYFDEKDYQKAVANYKQALILDPKDEETRYNYALARKMLEEQQNQDQDDSENQDQNQEGDYQDQNKNSKDQDKSDQDGKDDQQDQSGQNPNQDQGQQNGGQNGNKEGEGNQPQQQNILKGADGKGSSSPQAQSLEYQENLLEALRQQEQETLKRIISQKAEKVRVNTDKDW